MARYIVWPCGHGIVYGMSWRGLAWYMIWPAGHDTAHGIVTHGSTVMCPQDGRG